MNIQTQCCGVIVLFVLYLFYRRQEKVELNTEKAYWRAFCITVLSICMDILSIVAIVNMDRLPLQFVNWVCKTYLVSMIGVALSSLLYIYADLYSKNGQYQKFIKKYIALAVCGVILIYVLPINIYCSEGKDAVYTYGPSAMATYLFALSFVVMNTYSMIKHKDVINSRRREAVFVWMSVWISAAVVQFFFKDILIIGYAFAMGIMILYLKLENPEQNLDKRTGMFNQNAFTEYTQQMFVEEKDFSILCLYFEGLFYQNTQKDVNEDVRLQISRYLLNISNARVFKNAEDEVVLLFEDSDYAKEVVEQLKVRFDDKWGRNGSVIMRLRGIFIPKLSVISDAADIPYLLRYVRENGRKYTENDFLTVKETMVSDMYEERITERLILNAIENDRIEVFYQPIYSVREQRFSCAEALVRMRDEDGKLIPPMQFIEVAERNGLIIKVGEIVFEKVCRLIKEKNISRYGLKYIEVNLSVVQCAYSKLAKNFMRIMDGYGIDPACINLEITESASLTAKNILMDNMQKLLEYGVSFSLDDFGTGQSNLNYIVDMPVSIVKFDKDMTSAYFENGKAKYVMDAAMHMIQGMNLEIVSEGIETREQFETMRELGISYIQGYYFSKPLPEEEFLEFLSRF